jgi:hypothetical protein
VRLRIREHGRFRLGDNARRPMILIGNGSGLAGLRGLLRARIALGVRENWLLFGERNARMISCCAASWKAGVRRGGWKSWTWRFRATSRMGNSGGCTCRMCCVRRLLRCGLGRARRGDLCVRQPAGDGWRGA